MRLSVSEAAKQWGVSRTTIYQKVNSGEISRDSDKKIDVSEMLRIFGEPLKIEQPENVLNKTVNLIHKTPLNTRPEQMDTVRLEHKLDIENLKNEHFEKQVNEQKILIEDYQQQIRQLNKSLAQATASINEFAQTRLLELKISQTNFDEQGLQEEQKVNKNSERKNEQVSQESNLTDQDRVVELIPLKKKKWYWW